MSIKEVEITIDRELKKIVPGLKQGLELMQKVNLSHDEYLLLEVEGDIDIPLKPSDYIAITGGEVFSVGSGHEHIEENPHLRNPIRFTLNGQLISENKALKRSKITAIELKNIFHEIASDEQVAFDLSGIADVILEDHQVILIKPTDHLIAIPAHHHESREVIVTIDGNGVSVAAGDYKVKDLKIILGVSQEYVLEHVEGANFTTLEDESVFKLRHHEKFISHVRTGSSS